MAGKFEWQFKYRDEADVNAAARHACGKFKKPPIDGHFCDSSDSVYRRDLRTTITIARGGGVQWRPPAALVVNRDPAAPGFAKDWSRLRQGATKACGPEMPKLWRRQQVGALHFGDSNRPSRSCGVPDRPVGAGR
ncbi:hypothetical protein [Bradyrhizobium sp. AS23.2]|uniref:hypothetical protein n=1 Tax=Bradyrhizobium sp. AS23.2 TaxID=1680155 RepID=UPI000B14FC88|nr:hypothetical protein [Bradyrhizobium sp. AS23.2]